MIKKPDEVFKHSRRTTLKTAGLALCAGMLPLGATAASSGRVATYRRPNVSGKHGERMLKSYAKAVRAMLELPPEDPRNWYRQAIIHTLDCPHGNWWFMPWHRGYLGWLEKICRELSGDPQFALPYWDWTIDQKVPDCMFDDVLDPNHPAYMSAVQDFERSMSGVISGAGYWTMQGERFNGRTQLGQLLARRIRFEQDLMFDIVDDPSGRMFFDQPGARGIRREQAGFSLATSDACAQATIHTALAAPDFLTFGSPKSANHATMAGYGVLEARPHNSVHRCLGSRDCNFVEPRGFMGKMLSPVDPIFFLHHGNIDRLWDVWTRKQLRLGLSHLPAGSELITKLPDEQKSPAERATDYYRWARQPFLFFVDAQGKPAAQTRAGDYASMASFNYDYEPGTGEEVVPAAPAKPRPRAGRIASGTILRREVYGTEPATAVLRLPGARLEQVRTAGQVMVANITLNFPLMAHDAYVVVLNGPDDPTQVDAGSPFYLATIMMFGHRGACGALTYTLPLTDKLRQASAAQPLSADGTIRVRIVPMQAMPAHHHHPGMTHGEAVELLAVNVEAY
ncbi:tyrosinase family protein [Massilia sp. H6]|uniref:tyrosinase family protein n=1 Tax=Massilia sp. H6 TaxID=2970464 RepID=UPI00216AAFCF|nr:tyrosinase family protein [Massilia sp. H6]UVW29114.1 tyrosinase family protein [Massilia sp. H6]